ncbi:hypothetical protein [Cloacibacillus porcorum]|nr:hypothetical protein [Cloacibacillus porcorum]
MGSKPPFVTDAAGHAASAAGTEGCRLMIYENIYEEKATKKEAPP